MRWPRCCTRPWFPSIGRRWCRCIRGKRRLWCKHRVWHRRARRNHCQRNSRDTCGRFHTEAWRPHRWYQRHTERTRSRCHRTPTSSRCTPKASWPCTQRKHRLWRRRRVWHRRKRRSHCRRNSRDTCGRFHTEAWRPHSWCERHTEHKRSRCYRTLASSRCKPRPSWPCIRRTGHPNDRRAWRRFCPGIVGLSSTQHTCWSPYRKSALRVRYSGCPRCMPHTCQSPGRRHQWAPCRQRC